MSMKNNFGPWFRRKKPWKAPTAVATIVTTVLASTYLNWVKEHLPFSLEHYVYSPVAVVALLESLVLLVLGLQYMTEDRARTSPALEASQSLRQFVSVWQWLWIAWALMYFVLGVMEAYAFAQPGWKNANAVAMGTIRNAISNIVTLHFVASYFTMYEETGPSEGGNQFRRIFRRYLPWIVCGWFIFTVANAVVPELADEEYVLSAFDFAAALGSVSGMCLFIGRLESKFVSPPRRWVLVLYCYAALQPIIVLWPYDSRVAVGSICAAFGLKVLLFLIVYWFLDSGRALYYFHRMKRLHGEVEAEWNHFYDTYVRDSEKGDPPASSPEVTAKTPPAPSTSPPPPSASSSSNAAAAPTGLFISAPIASLADGERVRFERAVAGVRGALEKATGAAVYRVEKSTDFAIPAHALRSDTAQIARSRVFVLLWYHKIPTSALFEAGYAYARKIPIVVLTKSRADLPFLLRDLPSVDPRSYVAEVELADAPEWVTGHWEQVAAQIDGTA